MSRRLQVEEHRRWGTFNGQTVSGIEVIALVRDVAISGLDIEVVLETTTAGTAVYYQVLRSPDVLDFDTLVGMTGVPTVQESGRYLIFYVTDFGEIPNHVEGYPGNNFTISMALVRNAKGDPSFDHDGNQGDSFRGFVIRKVG
jgi:hypothetical protein